MLVIYRTVKTKEGNKKVVSRAKDGLIMIGCSIERYI